MAEGFRTMEDLLLAFEEDAKKVVLRAEEVDQPYQKLEDALADIPEELADGLDADFRSFITELVDETPDPNDLVADAFDLVMEVHDSAVDEINNLLEGMRVLESEITLAMEDIGEATPEEVNEGDSND